MKGELNRRRRWHPSCVDSYNASDPREVRRRLRKRDRGVCAHCRLDSYALGRELRGRGRTRALRERGFKPRQSLWEVDHIVPLIDGGGHDLSNLQSLCAPCHKEKTAREARERARRAAEAREPACDSRASSAQRQRGAAPGTRAPRALDALLEHAEQVNARVAELLGQHTGSPSMNPRKRAARSAPIR